MRGKILWIFLLAALLGLPASAQDRLCHYSCETCRYNFHQYCYSCPSDRALVVVKNPADVPSEYRDSKVPTGICTPEASRSAVNALGIVLVISAFILVPLARSEFLFYIVLTLQSVNLLSFLQVGWLSPLNYLLYGLQYLTPCNLATADIKVSSQDFRQYSFYYLHSFFKQASLQKSLAFVGVMDLVVFVLLVLVEVVKYIKLKHYAGECRNVMLLTEWAMNMISNFLKCLYFLLIQETVLSIAVSLQFDEGAPNSFALGAIIAYSLCTALYILYIFKFKISLLPNRLIQLYAIVKKIIYPILVIIQFQYHFFLIVVMCLNCALEAFFEYKIGLYTLRSKQFMFKCLEFLAVFSCGLFYAMDSRSDSPATPMAFSIIASVFLCGMMAFMYVEAALSIKERIMVAPKKDILIENGNQNKMVPEVSVLDREGNQTGLMSTKRNEKTEESFLDPPDKPMERINRSIKEEELEEEIEPPKADRDKTKDSSFKNSTQQKEDVEDSINLQELDQPKMVDREGKNQADEKEKQKAREKEQDAKALAKRAELKKRYGV